MKLGLHLIENNGKWRFVGDVPYNLLYQAVEGYTLSAKLVEEQHMLPSYARKKIRTLSWESKEQALKYAEKFGINILV